MEREVRPRAWNPLLVDADPEKAETDSPVASRKAMALGTEIMIAGY